MESTRQKKFARAIQRDLSDILNRELDGLPPCMVTLSYVRVTPDLQQARAYITCYPDQYLKETLDILNGENAKIRHLLSMRIRHLVKSMPTLVFYEDDILKTANRLDAIFDEIHKTQPPAPAEAEE